MGNCKSKGNCKSNENIPNLDLVSIGENSDTTLDTKLSNYSSEVFEQQSSSDPIIVIRQSLIGGLQMISTPFGSRQLVYADYTASGRYLKIIEDFLASNVYPFYANTHTEASATGAITTHLREEARQIVSKSLNAPQDKYAVLFVGTGCTGAIEKMMKILGIYLPKLLHTECDLSKMIPLKHRPVVFIGPFEHHSNELPWRESIATLVVIPEDEDGCPDLNVLEAKLIKYKDRRTKIGSFCAGSNVTGICIDTKKYTRLLHKYNALAFFDFAGSGAYVEINMDSNKKCEAMDAVFMSPHKFIGGPGCSGLLVAKRSIFSSIKSPTFPGGGTVSFVTPSDQDYDHSIEAREDAGTPGIVQAIRTGLVFRVKEIVGCQRIQSIEREYCKIIFSKLRNCGNIELTGSDRGAYFDPDKRTTIFSFNIRTHFHAEFKSSGLKKVFSNPKMMLHPSFVVGILNDIYGIQARAGCSCTGPYGHRIFGVDDGTSDRIRVLTKKGYNVFKFGWARVNFNYFISPEEVEFICDAILQIAEYGWLLLPLYQQDASSGLCVYRGRSRASTLIERPSLNQLQLKMSGLEFATEDLYEFKKNQTKLQTQILNNGGVHRDANSFRKVMKDAKNIYSTADKYIKKIVQKGDGSTFDTFTQPLTSSVVSPADVWWVTSEDVVQYLSQSQKS